MMPRDTRDEDRLTEDEIARRKLGPRGVPGGPDTSKMTPQQKKNIPKTGEFDGHTAWSAELRLDAFGSGAASFWAASQISPLL
jgi:hypothetical protein